MAEGQGAADVGSGSRNQNECERRQNGSGARQGVKSHITDAGHT